MSRRTVVISEVAGNHKHDDSSYSLLSVSRYAVLILVLMGLICLPYEYLLTPDPSRTEDMIVDSTNCTFSHFGTANQKRHQNFIATYNGQSIVIPHYANADINVANENISDAVIIQHGNLRNADQYLCAAQNAISRVNDSSTLILATQFLIHNDSCWNAKTDSLNKINIHEDTTCGYPIWSNEGWKDGLKSVNKPSIFSFDVYNIIINHLGDKSYFPNLRTITLFGFSAGAQTVLRYSMLPIVNIEKIPSLRFVISDPSTFLYLNKERPFPNKTVGFAVPDSSWLQSSWQHNAIDGSDWTPAWSDDCSGFNKWRYGFDDLTGYFEKHLSPSSIKLTDIIKKFGNRDIHYLIGTHDNRNCRLHDFAGCNDNELVAVCKAMLQGENRLDRMLKWKNYLKHFFGYDVHSLVLAHGVGHNAVDMLTSPEGKCLVFGICD